MHVFKFITQKCTRIWSKRCLLNRHLCCLLNFSSFFSYAAVSKSFYGECFSLITMVMHIKVNLQESLFRWVFSIHNGKTYLIFFVQPPLKVNFRNTWKNTFLYKTNNILVIICLFLRYTNSIHLQSYAITLYNAIKWNNKQMKRWCGNYLFRGPW